jgi:threonine dehydratase
VQPDSEPDFAAVAAAQGRLSGLAHRTPVLTSHTANQNTGAELFFKAENFQRTGSFKFRGAANTIAQLDDAARSRGVLAFSSGNHAQAVALAAGLAGVRATIVMPTDAPPTKLAATRAYGAEIVLYDRYREDREAIARNLAAESGATLIPPFDHPQVIAGQGTCAAELFAHTGKLDLLLVCLGGGGLLAGCALAAAELSPGCQVIGVEPHAGNDAQQSLRAGRRIGIEVPISIADGALTTMIGALPFAIIQRLVHDIVTVDDAALLSAMGFFAERMKITVEPTGCLAAAAAFTGAVTLSGKRVGVIISGGNTDLLTRFLH